MQISNNLLGVKGWVIVCAQTPCVAWAIIHSVVNISCSFTRQLHIVSTTIEHSSILETLRMFETQGISVSYINPGPDGVVRAEDVLAAITPQTVLVTCMYANNEIGTIQPVSKIGAGIRKIRAQKISRTANTDTVSDSSKSSQIINDLELLRSSKIVSSSTHK